MKYIDADKLIKSVNNYQEGAKAALNPTDGDADYYKGKIDACKDIQEFITSLQQEQPEVDLEKEIDDYMYPIQSWEVQEEPFTSLDKCARHFYELGKTVNDMDKIEKIRQEIERLQQFNRSMADNAINSNMRNFYDGSEDCCRQLLSFLDTLSKEPDKSLEDAAREYCKTIFHKPFSENPQEEHIVYEPDKYAGFIAGAKWQAERILEHVKLAYGKISMNPFDCSEAFEELISKIESI